MARYVNVFMIFADGSLVVLAENLDTGRERGFRTFRYCRNKLFRLFLQDQEIRRS